MRKLLIGIHDKYCSMRAGPDWDDINHWHNSGLWDLILDGQGNLQRVLNEDYAAVFREILQDVLLEKERINKYSPEDESIQGVSR